MEIASSDRTSFYCISQLYCKRIGYTNNKRRNLARFRAAKQEEEEAPFVHFFFFQQHVNLEDEVFHIISICKKAFVEMNLKDTYIAL
jgi:hypothetical protein